MQNYIFQHIQIDFVCVYIIEMAEYTRDQEEQDMDIPDLSSQEFISMQDEDINNFITELFNENNALPKCELDQWLEDYLEEMEVEENQQQDDIEQSQQLSNENNISLLDMCNYSDISSVEDDDNSPTSGQFEENENQNYYEKDDNRDNFYNCCNCIFCSGSTMYGWYRRNICTDPVTIQHGRGLPPMYDGDEQQQQQQNYEKEQQQEQEEEEVLGDDDLTVNVFNFPSTFFI